MPKRARLNRFQGRAASDYESPKNSRATGVFAFAINWHGVVVGRFVARRAGGGAAHAAASGVGPALCACGTGAGAAADVLASGVASSR